MLHLTSDRLNDGGEQGRAFIFSFFSLLRRELMRICQVTEESDRRLERLERVGKP